MEYEDARREAIEHLAEGRPADAFGAFRSQLTYPVVLDGPRWADAFELFARIAEAVAGPELASKIERVANEPDEPDALYDAAYALYEQKLHGIAATLLARANRLSPSSPKIVTELAANLEALSRNREAAALLRTSGLAERDPWCAYLFAFNSLMGGDLVAARQTMNVLEDPDDDNLAFAVSAVRDMLVRADAIESATPLDASDLCGWHMVVNAGVLLHESPHGFEEGMRGRYAYVQDDYDLLRAGIDGVRLVLETAGLPVDRVWALPDRSSRILAMATASILRIPCAAWKPDAGAGLVVAYDMDRVGDGDVLTALAEHRPGQVLWAHASSWTEPFPYTPDLTTLLYQHLVTPWDGGGMTIDPQTQEVVEAGPDPAPEAEIAKRISAASPDTGRGSTDRLSAIVSASATLTGTAAPGFVRTSGKRTRQRDGSPVDSNRFT